MFKSGEEEFSKYCVTNTDGFCEIRGLIEAEYDIRVSFIGFRNYEETLSINEAQIQIESIELEESLGELDELYVYGEKEITTGQVGITRVSAQDISRVPSMSIDGDLMSYLQTVPGVVTVGDQGGDLYIRGGTPAQNYVLIDNIPIVKPFHISNLFSAFPEQAISSIDIMAGGFDNEHMGGTSAIIDATLKTGDFKTSSASASFSPYISTLFYEGPLRKEKSSLMINGRLSTINDFSGYLGTREQDMEFYDIIARYSLQGNGFNCSVSGVLTGDEGRISRTRENYLQWSNTGFGIRCFGFDESFNHPYEVSLGYSKFENSEGDQFNKDRSSSLSYTYLKLDLEEYLAGQKIDYGFSLMIQEYSATIAEKFTNFDFLEVKIPVFQVYVKSEIEISERLKILPSIGTQATSLSKSTFEPRFRALWRPNGDNRTEISFATGIYHQIQDGITDQRDAGTTFTVYRTNDYGELPPRAFHLIGGLKNRISDRLVTNFEVYYKKHDDIPVSKWTPEARLELETASANSEGYGADFRIKYDSKNFYGYVGYGWSKVAYKAAVNDLGAWINGTIFSYSPPHDQRHKLSTVANYRFGKFTTRMSWDFGSGLPYTRVFGFDLLTQYRTRDIIKNPGIARTLYAEPYNARLPYYHRLDIAVKRSFDISNDFKIEAEIGSINVYDRSNVFYVDLNTIERVDQTPFLPYFSIKASIN